MKIYTTTQVSKVCKVSPRTVAHWCERGRLKYYRLPSGDRRITHDNLVAFMDEYAFPKDALEEVS